MVVRESDNLMHEGDKMEMFPQLTGKPLGDCEPGELVRVVWGNAKPFAFVAANDEYQFLVFLTAIADEAPPRITILERPDLPSLSYGNTYRIELDQDTDHVDLTGQHLWDQLGAIHIVDDHYVMRVAGLGGSRIHGSLFIQLDTGMLTDEPVGGAAILGRWSLMLPKGEDQYETLLTIG